MNDSGAVRRFMGEDQEAFAILSGDRNPIHLDEIAARRTQAGAPVVHGVHGLLWALDVIARLRALAGVNAISARFNRFIYVGAKAEIVVRAHEGALTADIVADGLVATTIRLQWGDPRAPVLPDSLFPTEAAPLGCEPDDRTFTAMANLSGRIPLPKDGLAEAMFPALAKALGADVVTAIAVGSGVVGMSCPGLHSLFSQLDLHRMNGPATDSVAWRSARTDARARWVTLDLTGAGWEGAIISFARAEPVAPRSMDQLAALVEPNMFAGRKALVIGGSRGLGAVTAKLIAAGGGRVVITYVRGAADAEAVAREIRKARGVDACATLRCDVTLNPAAALAGLEGVTHLYYFATPLIARQRARFYERERLADFLAVYVNGFEAVWEAMAAQRPLTALYPSTVFLDQRPKGMTEYVMAKAAAECLCADLAKRDRGVTLTTPRLPRVFTDQTATVPPTPAADALEVMLPLLKAQSNR